MKNLKLLFFGTLLLVAIIFPTKSFALISGFQVSSNISNPECSYTEPENAHTAYFYYLLDGMPSVFDLTCYIDINRGTWVDVVSPLPNGNIYLIETEPYACGFMMAGYDTIAECREEAGYISESIFTFNEISAIPSILVVPEEGLADLTAPITGFASDLWVYIALLMGIPLAFYVINKVVAIASDRNERNDDI
jgi:hypothetical protein